MSINNLNINKHLKELKGEIEMLGDDLEKDEQLQRLKKMWVDYNGDDRIISSQEIYEKMLTEKEIELIPTGFPSLDKILGGFAPSQLITISAPTKSGKTSFCMDLTTKLKDYTPLWLSFEEPVRELISKFIERKEVPPLFMTPKQMTGNKCAWVEERIMESKAKFDSRIVFIDHLHFIIDMINGNNVSLEIGATMRELKQMAKRWGIVIVLVAHMKKTNPTEPVTIDDLRDSSFVAQESDTVITLWRQAEWVDKELNISDNVKISVQANRRTGKTGNLDFVFIKGHFLEQDWIHDDD
jgi:replicative DNA helicase